MTQHIRLLSIVVATCLASTDLTRAQSFDECGTLVQGVECVLFRTDGGSEYVLSFEGEFTVGDRVHVSGSIRSDCVTICQEGDGCIDVITIEAVDAQCPAPPIEICGIGLFGLGTLALLPFALAARVGGRRRLGIIFRRF